MSQLVLMEVARHNNTESMQCKVPPKCYIKVSTTSYCLIRPGTTIQQSSKSILNKLLPRPDILRALSLGMQLSTNGISWRKKKCVERMSRRCGSNDCLDVGIEEVTYTQYMTVQGWQVDVSLRKCTSTQMTRRWVNNALHQDWSKNSTFTTEHHTLKIRTQTTNSILKCVRGFLLCETTFFG